MSRPARNQLVWIRDDAWLDALARLPDEQAREIGTCWRMRRLPLVVTTQPKGIDAGRLALGLPAPRGWSRRRLAFDVACDAIRSGARFPTLRQAASHYAWGWPAQELDHAFASLGTVGHVYGSHGWQLLTGQPYLHDGSDIDLSIDVADFATACSLVKHLEHAGLNRRLDGEIVFSGEFAVAWRELSRLLEEGSDEVLVKRLDGPRLVPADFLRRHGRSGSAIRMPVAAATASCAQAAAS